MKKFKVGDKVRGITNKRYCVTNENMYLAEVTSVKNNGFIEVKILDHKDRCEVNNKYNGLDPNYFELVERCDDKIIIYRNGNKVVAKNTYTKQEAVARCSPEDEFDFYLGATLALSRLVDKAEENKEQENKLLNCKFVVAMCSGYYCLTKGRIYTVVDGHFKKGDTSYPINGDLHTFSELECYLNEEYTSDTFHQKFGGVHQIVEIVE